MKIAILMFGQPRFLKQTINLIKDEFDLPGHEVHYFAHWWNSIGYLPNGKEEIYDKKEIYDLVDYEYEGIRDILDYCEAILEYREDLERANRLWKQHA